MSMQERWGREAKLEKSGILIALAVALTASQVTGIHHAMRALGRPH